MTLLYYDKNTPVESLMDLAKKFREVLGENSEILFLPKSIDVCLNASKEQLWAAKNMIETAIKLQETN